MTKPSFNKSLSMFVQDTTRKMNSYEFNELEVKSFAKDFLKQIQIDSPTTRQCKIVANQILSSINKHKMETEYKHYIERTHLNFIKKVDIYSLDSIRFIDTNFNGYELYYHNVDGDTVLYNSNGKIIGKMFDWIDDHDEIPKEFKTIDNKVLNPVNKLPVLLIRITQTGSGFEPIEPGIYKEYEYNDSLETLCKTNHIIRNV